MSREDALARIGIQDTMSRYSIAVDNANLVDFLPNFTEDIDFQTPLFACKSKDELEKYYTTRFAPESRVGLRFRRHNLTTCQIDIESPTTARARTYYYVMTEIGPDHCGFYVDRFRLDQGRWLIAYREVWVDWSHPQGICTPDHIKKLLIEKGSRGPTTTAA